MKAQTAMQELIQELKDISSVGSNPFITTTLNLIIDLAEEKLEKEKQQIIDANNAGWRTHRRKENQSAEDYYNETFGEI